MAQALLGAWIDPPNRAPAFRQAKRHLHLFGRSCDPSHLGLRLENQPNSEHRPDCPGRSPFRGELLHQFDLRAKPASILTGKHSHKNGFKRNGNRFDPGQMTFPKLLQKVGYRTAVFGKWHLGTNPTGFDQWMVYPGQGSYYKPDYITPEGKKVIPGYSVEVTTDLALDFLSKQKKDKPFLLMCQYKAPHRNWMPGPKYLTKYDDVSIPEPETLFDDYSKRASVLGKHKMGIDAHMSFFYDLKVEGHEDKRYAKFMNSFLGRMSKEQRQAWDAAYGPKNEAFLKANLQGKELVRWKYQRYVKDYLRCVAAVDDGIGRILKSLDKLGLSENSIVIYASDQGFYLGEHGWYDKRWIYEESLKMPLVMRWPGKIKPGDENQKADPEHRLRSFLSRSCRSRNPSGNSRKGA